MTEIPSAGAGMPERERRILELLQEADGGVVARDELGGGRGSRAVDMAVSRLRKRLGPDGPQLLTVRGRGYRLVARSTGERLALGWGELDLDGRRVHLRDREVSLTEIQAALLRRLAGTPGQLVSRTELLRGLWDADQADRLDLALHRLRGRLEEDPARPRFVVSVRGKGVVLLDARRPEEAAAPPPPDVGLIGRDDELAAARGAVLDKRRVVVHGPPGIGKSALAAAVVRDWLGAARGRGWLRVDLHGVDDTDADARLAASLGMESVANDELVARSLRSRGPLMLLVDGALPSSLPARLDGWLGGAPQLLILVAARQACPGWPTVDLEGLGEEAAALLLERAAGRPVDGGGRIARRVEGNPMALQLLGRALEHTTPNALQRRLDLPLAPLLGAWRSCLDELGAAERSAALATSLLRRPFDADDVAAIADLPVEQATLTVEGLVARSILHRAAGGRVELPNAARDLLRADLRREGGLDATRTRLRARCHAVLEGLAEAIPRQGGPSLDELQDRWPDLGRSLELGDGGPVADALLLARVAREAGERVPRLRREGWAGDLEESASREDLSGAARAECLRTVHALRWEALSRSERETMLRHALDLAVGDGAAVAAGAIAAELASIVAFSFGEREARQLLRSHPLPDDAPSSERVRRDRHVGRLSIFAGRPRRGVPRLERAVEQAEAEGLPLLEARCRVALGQALSASATGAEQAEHHLRRAMALTREHGLPEQNVRATLRLAQHLLRLGLRVDAAGLLDEALGAAVRAGLVRLEEQCVSALGFLLVGQRRLPEALEHLDRAVQLSRAAGGQRALYVALSNRGLARALAGDPPAGRRDLTEALESVRGGGGWYGGLGLAYRAVAELLDGADPEAVTTAGEATGVLASLEHPDAADLVAGLAVLRGFASGSTSANEVRRWVDAWRGAAELEGFVQGLERRLLQTER